MWEANVHCWALVRVGLARIVLQKVWSFHISNEVGLLWPLLLSSLPDLNLGQGPKQAQGDYSYFQCG